MDKKVMILELIRELGDAVATAAFLEKNIYFLESLDDVNNMAPRLDDLLAKATDLRLEIDKINSDVIHAFTKQCDTLLSHAG